MSSPMSAVRPIAHNIMNSFFAVRSRHKYGGEARKSFLYLLVKYCVHLFFFSSFNRATVAFFVLWCVSASLETCWLDFWRRRCLLRNYFLVLYDYPRCNTCSLSEWLCSRRSRIVCDALLLYFFKSLFSLVHTTVAGNLSNVSFLTLPFRTRRHSFVLWDPIPFYVGFFF